MEWIKLMKFIQYFQCRTTSGVDWIDELHPRFPVQGHIRSGLDWIDELHPRFPVQDHIRGVGEGVFHVDGFCTVFSYRVFLYRDSCGSFF